MEAYSKSSWFLLLLGFAFVAATLQGMKGVAETDGPSETDCRLYIEKALKELEISDMIETKQKTSGKDESVEDVPTVEITDDSSYQEFDNSDQGEVNKENEAEKGKSQESVEENEATQQETIQESTPDSKSEEDFKDTPYIKDVDRSEEKNESAEDPTPSKEESAQQDEQAGNTSPQIESQVNYIDRQGSVEQEEPQFEQPEIVLQEVAAVTTQQLQVEGSAEYSEKGQREGNNVKDEPEESEENNGESIEADVRESVEISKENRNEDQSMEEASKAKELSAEEETESKEDVDNKVDDKTEEDDSKEEENREDISYPFFSEDGCPSIDHVSCTEGELCSKHKNCGENKICCPNKCYRKRCVTGRLSKAELLNESESEEDSQEEGDKKEKTVADKTPETGCPPPSQLVCTEGVLCSNHKECGDGKICCPNKCYRKRCIFGTAPEAELLAEESDEDSKEQEEYTRADEVKTEDSKLGLASGCPMPGEVSCEEGELCNTHKECAENKICCPNKCYRKRCISGNTTEVEIAAEELEEDIKENEGVNSFEHEPAQKTEDSGCPKRDEIPCKGGERCENNKDCDIGEICCPNKCYNKLCVPGTSDFQERDVSKEETKADKSVETKIGSTETEEETDCPPPNQVSCKDGQKCGDDDDCRGNEICCSNKCYTKRCVPKRAVYLDYESEEVVEPVEKLVAEPKVKVKSEKETEVKMVPQASPSLEARKDVRKHYPKKSPKPIKFVGFEEDESLEKGGEAPMEELCLDTKIPTELRSRDHVEHLLKLDEASSKTEIVQNNVYEETLNELKRLYENAIKPLEVLYKYRDLSNRHFGDAEIFSKPLILFMGPWSGGKSSIINYLVNNEYNETSLRTGAEPSPAYFNLLMYGDEPEIIDGTELAADFTFSGLQKFGQGLEERLRGVKIPAKLLEKVNIVEIPGILEVRKQVSRIFPFNDACQWFIDRADIIFLVYDPSKLDVGPETEAILDQLKGREHQTRIILNKADQVKPEELMRVQGALIWNISPLMSSPQPPAMYTTSLWSRPYEPWAPVRLLQAQERAFLRDLRSAIDKRIENKIASARRFAVRVRNHAKMVDCYLTTYYNHKSVFGNRKQVANEIIEHPQDYHIYEGLSTLTNISRYDLPDPDVYKDFFKLNPLYEFQQLSATCTYFRGCPINRLDIAIAYDLPELVGNYKRNMESLTTTTSSSKEESISKKSKKSAPES